MKKGKLKKQYRVILKMLVIILLAILLYNTMILYNNKTNKIEKIKNNCFKQATTNGQKYNCFK